ncbi:2-C-methyl-D-erythritol 4-phosphate cytidylyltransferase, partial [Paramuribaculum intestinale]
AYVAVQTPQGFSGMEFRQAYGMPYSPAFTDDASVMEAAGYDVSLVEGSPVNIKVTNPSDIAIAELLLRQCND